MTHSVGALMGLECLSPTAPSPPGKDSNLAHTNGHVKPGLVSEHLNGQAIPDAEFLRNCAWLISERNQAGAYVPPGNYVGLAMVTPCQGFAHWRIHQDWVDQTAWQRGQAWHHCRLVLRLYDVSHIHFNGFNAHQIHDHTLPQLSGRSFFFTLPRPGTSQLAEVGFLLGSGEFIPAARSGVVFFAPDAGSPRHDPGGLLVDEELGVQTIDNVWEQERILHELRQPRLRHPLRIALFAFASRVSGQQGAVADFVSELAMGQQAHGNEVHVFVPTSGSLATERDEEGVLYHPLDVAEEGSPQERACAFSEGIRKQRDRLSSFDLLHVADWMAGLALEQARAGVEKSPPLLLSLSSIEATRRNGTPASDLSCQIEEIERKVARDADTVLASPWLSGRAARELGVKVCSFPMEGRVDNEWDAPLDLGHVKMGIGVGPLDRLILFVGPLEHAAGVDLLLEALPVLLQRVPNLRLACAGGGCCHDYLNQRMHQLGIAHAVRLLGHVDRSLVTQLLRAAEALVLPSRYRVPFDDAVVDLARRAGRPVITTQGGPAHLVRHEETGILTYDNPGSMVWAVDRILGDPSHAERLGRNGKQEDSSAPNWTEIARRYLELCANRIPALTENGPRGTPR
jgi:glycogen(starch) synthase